MMQDDGPMAEVGMHVSTPAQADWSFEEVEKVARTLYAHAPFKVNDQERWKALVRQVFDFLDNLDLACEEILRKRMEKREIAGEASVAAHAASYLPFTVQFERAARFITGEKRKDRALSKLDKVYVKNGLCAEFGA